MGLMGSVYLVLSSCGFQFSLIFHSLKYPREERSPWSFFLYFGDQNLLGSFQQLGPILIDKVFQKWSKIRIIPVYLFTIRTIFGRWKCFWKRKSLANQNLIFFESFLAQDRKILDFLDLTPVVPFQKFIPSIHFVMYFLH